MVGVCGCQGPECQYPSRPDNVPRTWYPTDPWSQKKRSSPGSTKENFVLLLLELQNRCRYRFVLGFVLELVEIDAAMNGANNLLRTHLYNDDDEEVEVGYSSELLKQVLGNEIPPRILNKILLFQMDLIIDKLINLDQFNRSILIDD